MWHLSINIVRSDFCIGDAGSPRTLDSVWEICDKNAVHGNSLAPLGCYETKLRDFVAVSFCTFMHVLY